MHRGFPGCSLVAVLLVSGSLAAWPVQKSDTTTNSLMAGSVSLRVDSVRRVAPRSSLAILEIEYAAGLAALNSKNWTFAILTFERIRDNAPNFRDVNRRLASANRRLQRGSQPAILLRYYADAMTAMDWDDWDLAARALEKVNQINPDYLHTRRLLTNVRTLMQERNRILAAATPLPVATTVLDSLYRRGVNAFASGDWKNAIVSFDRLKTMQATYRNVDELLLLAWSNLNSDQFQQVDAPSRLDRRTKFYLAVLLTAASMLFTVLAAGSLPHLRARYHLWRGRDNAAAEIYESILRRHPTRAKYYSPLADIYLKLDRKDDNAMKVYRAVVDLNLPTPRLEQINDLMAQKYVEQGQVDAEAIHVLEQALRAELRRQDYLISLKSLKWGNSHS